MDLVKYYGFSEILYLGKISEILPVYFWGALMSCLVVSVVLFIVCIVGINFQTTWRDSVKVKILGVSSTVLAATQAINPLTVFP